MTRDATSNASSCADSALPSPAMQKLVIRMLAEALTARIDPVDTTYAILVRPSAGASLSAGRVGRDLLDEAVKYGLMRATRRGLYALVPDVAAKLAPAKPAADDARQSDIAVAPLMNDAESPLMWLYRRKGQDGRPFLDDVSFLAGERFRRDVTQASMLPSVTTNWTRMESTTGRAEPRDPAMASDHVIAARQRVRAAFQLLGTDTGNFVLDVCGFLVPLQEAENRRSWPPRSAKLVLKLALARLADHYGLQQQATGADRSTISSWQSSPERATINAWLGGA